MPFHQKKGAANGHSMKFQRKCEGWHLGRDPGPRAIRRKVDESGCPSQAGAFFWMTRYSVAIPRLFPSHLAPMSSASCIAALKQFLWPHSKHFTPNWPALPCHCPMCPRTHSFRKLFELFEASTTVRVRRGQQHTQCGASLSRYAFYFHQAHSFKPHASVGPFLLFYLCRALRPVLTYPGQPLPRYMCCLVHGGVVRTD